MMHGTEDIIVIQLISKEICWRTVRKMGLVARKKMEIERVKESD